MAENKYWTLIRRLNAETHRNKIAWEKMAIEGAYQAVFMGYTIVLETSEPGAPAMQYMRIMNPAGELIEVITDEDINNSTSSKGAFSLMCDTYGAARRRAMGVEAALDMILGTLDPADDEVPF